MQIKCALVGCPDIFMLTHLYTCMKVELCYFHFVCPELDMGNVALKYNDEIHHAGISAHETL